MAAELDRRRCRFDFRFIPDAEIATYFAAADVVLAPYRIEAQSGVALTAFHFARPVIASDASAGCRRSSTGTNGIVVPARGLGALARAVDEFFTDARPRGDGARGARRRRARYSWAEYAAVLRRAWWTGR